MRFILSILFITTLFAATAAAQSKAELQKFFHGKQVTLRIEMPTDDSVNVYPERSQSLDYDEYQQQIRKGGVNTKRGATAIIDSIKVRDRRIEVVLENQDAVSQFNLHYSRIDPWMLTSAALIDALNRYVEFAAGDKVSSRLVGSSECASGYVRRGVVHLGPRTTYLKLGLKTGEVLELLGEPASVSQRTENGRVISTYEFERSKGKVLIADFEEDTLVRLTSAERVATTTVGIIIISSS